MSADRRWASDPVSCSASSCARMRPGKMGTLRPRRGFTCPHIVFGNRIFCCASWSNIPGGAVVDDLALLKAMLERVRFDLRPNALRIFRTEQTDHVDRFRLIDRSQI